jgi:hypothetical protein
VFLLPVEEFSVGRFLDRCEHVEADVSFIADPSFGVDRFQDSGLAQCVAVVAAAVDGVGDPHEDAVVQAGDLVAAAGGLVLAGAQFAVSCPGPARKQRSVNGVLPPLVEVLGHWDVLGQHQP